MNALVKTKTTKQPFLFFRDNRVQVNRYHEFTAIRQKKSLYIEFLYNNKNLYHIHLQWMVTETEASTNPK